MADEAVTITEEAKHTDEQLVRGIGIPSLTANIVSSTIGAGIFVIPATVARGLGSAAPLAFICCAIAMILFVTCFAIAGSRVSLTGGLYAYVEVAFGKYIGFLAGVLYFLTALGAVAGIVNVLADSVALVIPFLGGSAMRIIVMLAVYGVLVFINIRGVREGAGAVTTITIAKLLPLLLFIGAGIFFIHPQNLTFTGWPGSKPLGDAVILLIFAFVGIEVALIPSGEVKNPARTVPRSAYLALITTTIIYIFIQIVAQGTPRDLKEAVGEGAIVEIEVYGIGDDELAAVRALDGVSGVIVEERDQAQAIVIQTAVGAEVTQAIMAQLEGVRLGRVTTREPTLEDAYVALVTDHGPAGLA